MSDDAGGSLYFDDAEVEALRTIASDWLNEQLVAAPYPAAVTSVLHKLAITDERDDPAPQAPAVVTADRPVQLDNASSEHPIAHVGR